jgi:penicillin amidase
MKALPLRFARPKISAARDDYGVPHLDAESWFDALYGLGYLHALDRPTQMLFSRVVASGRSAELIADKPELVETDRLFRRIGLHLRLEHEIELLDDHTRHQLRAYCDGVNDGLQHSGRSLPMWAVGFVPTPWDEAAVLLIGKLLSFGGLVVGQQQNERILFELAHAGVADDKLRELFNPEMADADFDLLRQLKIASQLSDEALELITDLPRLAGSNAWAIAPSRSATGSALLAGDPHLEINRLPAIWYEAVLRWGDRYVLGASLPGCPLFAVARTERLAWAVTYLKGDTSDYFVEDCRPGGETGWQFRRGDQWLDFALRNEEIVHKGKPKETMRVYHNAQGTLEVEPRPDDPGYYLSLAWTGEQPGASRSIGTWLDVIAAPTTLAAMNVARECPMPTLNWIFADRDGHIGRQANGWFPVRPGGQSGLLPIPAWDERNHWNGLLPTEQLPRHYDPAEGFVSSANENINPTRGPQLSTLTLPAYRKRRIDERLGSLKQATISDMQSVQYDVVSLQARDLLSIFLPHLPAGEFRRRLADWDCSYEPDRVEPTMFLNLYRSVLLEIFGHEQNIGWRRMVYLTTRIGFSTMVLAAIDRLLKQEDSLWWADRDKGEVIRRAAERAANQPAPPWRITNSFRFLNRFIGYPLVGRALGLHTGEMGMPGCHASPFQGHLLKTATRETTFAPSYHFVTDLATDEAWTNLPGGPSESGLSPFYKNDIPRWRNGVYKRLTP